jgi:hypothetical protein
VFDVDVRQGYCGAFAAYRESLPMFRIELVHHASTVEVPPHGEIDFAVGVGRPPVQRSVDLP